MSAFTEIPTGEDGLQKLYTWIDDYVDSNSFIAENIKIGISPEGRPIPGIFLS